MTEYNPWMEDTDEWFLGRPLVSSPKPRRKKAETTTQKVESTPVPKYTEPVAIPPKKVSKTEAVAQKLAEVENTLSGLEATLEDALTRLNGEGLDDIFHIKYTKDKLAEIKLTLQKEYKKLV